MGEIPTSMAVARAAAQRPAEVRLRRPREARPGERASIPPGTRLMAPAGSFTGFSWLVVEPTHLFSLQLGCISVHEYRAFNWTSIGHTSRSPSIAMRPGTLEQRPVSVATLRTVVFQRTRVMAGIPGTRETGTPSPKMSQIPWTHEGRAARPRPRPLGGVPIPESTGSAVGKFGVIGAAGR